MRFSNPIFGGVLAAFIFCVVGVMQAQQVNLQAPLVTATDSFSERFGVGFGFRFPGGFFNQNSFGVAQPPFADPGAVNSGANFGFSLGKGPYRANFNFAAGQGSRRSLVSQTPSVTVQNGGSGAIFDGTVRPFVTGVIPVVGGISGRVPPTGYAATRQYATPSGPTLYDRYQNYMAQKAAGTLPDTAPNLSEAAKREIEMASGLTSTAGHGDISVADIKRNRELARIAEEEAVEREVAALLAKAEGARSARKFGLAKVYYQQAAARAEEPLKAKIKAQIAGLAEQQ